MGMMMNTLAGAAVGMAMGAGVVYVATHDQRQVRKTIRSMTRGAEKALLDLDRMVGQYTR